MKKAIGLSIIGILIDVISLVGFASVLHSGPVNGLVDPALANWWLSLIMVIRLGFFFILGLLLTKLLTQPTPFLTKLKNWFISPGSLWKKIIRCVIWITLICLGFVQTIFDLVFIFLNYGITSDNVPALAQWITLGLLVMSVLVFSGLMPILYNRNNYFVWLSTPEKLQKLRIIYVVVFALSCVAFPFFTGLLALHSFLRINLPDLGTKNEEREPVQWFVIAQTFLSILILNFLHVEIAIEATSGTHSLIYYIQRVGMIFLLWYIPYKGVLWLANENRTKFELGWGIAYGALQILLVYVLL